MAVEEPIAPARPLPARTLAAFCAGTVAFLVYRDLFVPHVRDTEVWFGFEVHGPIAWITAPLHWLIFAVGTYGFWTQHPRIYGWASIYAFYIAASHVMWNLTSPSGGGWVDGLWQGAVFAIPAVVLAFRASAARSGRPHEGRGEVEAASASPHDTIR